MINSKDGRSCMELRELRMQELPAARQQGGQTVL